MFVVNDKEKTVIIMDMSLFMNQAIKKAEKKKRQAATKTIAETLSQFPENRE